MAFKVPLPKVAKNQHPDERETEPHIGLPGFNKSDLLNMTLIGQGAFGKVFKCIKDNVTFVMKQIDGSTDNEETQLLVKEARMLRSLKGHENVVEIQGFSYCDKAILLEYVSFSFASIGIEHEVVSTMKELLDVCDAINSFSGFQHFQMHLANDVAAGLEFLHSHNVAHRDLKPANVLVSNSHYTASSDVTSCWSVRPVIAKLSDFGESRSSMLQTRSLLNSATGRLNRGSPAYMAPEALAGNGFKVAHMDSLLAMDVWSFAMILFHLLNPNVRYPFAAEMDKKPKDVDTLEMLKRIHETKALPANDAKYSQYQQSVWTPLHDAYLMCAKFDARDRPSAKDIPQMLSDSYVTLDYLVLRETYYVSDEEVRFRCQSHEVNVSNNACSVLQLLKDDNTSYDAYNILQSSKLCSCHEIQFPLCSTTPKTAAEAKHDLCLCLCDVLADDSCYCAVYTLPPYSVLFCKATTGKIMLVDTQTHVTLTDAHIGGAAVCARRDETTVSALTNWLFTRMKLSGDVCHKLAVLKPVISKPCQQNVCDVNDELSLYLQCTDSISPCPDNRLIDEDSDGEHDYSTSAAIHQKILNRWGTSENSISNWQLCDEELVEHLPHDINGHRKFRLLCNAEGKEQIMKITKDGRPWKAWVTSSRKGFHGVRRIAKCGGGFTCASISCPFVREHGTQNKIHFQTKYDGTVCFVCGVPAQHTSCPAVKIWEFDKAYCEVVVYHRGEHTCAVKKRKCLSNAAILKAVRQNPSVQPSKIVHKELVNMMSADEFVWSDIETVADNLADLKRVQYERQKVKQYLNPCGENFEALGLLKQKCMEKDKYFIYKINDRSLNGLPSFVFKSSMQMGKLAMDMDRDESGVLKDEFAFVDAKHDRCRGFKSVTLWTYHPVMRKLLRLAVMEVEEENGENLTKFWNLLNEMLQEISGITDYKFNPCGFVADEHHANWTSIRDVFGVGAIERVVSCEFHFKQSVQRHAKYLKQSFAHEFICLAEKMLTAVTICDFSEACQSMQKYIEEQDCMQDWYDWWYKRRTHIFRAFKCDNVPRSNLAEVGHAKMASVGRPYMSLLEVAKDDVASAIRQEAEIRLFPTGLATGGRGVNVHQRMARNYKASLKRAKAFAKELHQQSSMLRPVTYVPTSGLHRPPNARLKSGRKQRTPSKTCDEGSSNMSQPVNDGRRKDTASGSKTTFHVVFFEAVRNVKKCYGCGKVFAAVHRKAPNNLILQHFCRRKYINKEGVEVLSRHQQAAYFHLNVSCARKCRSNMELKDIIVHDEVRDLLTAKHEAILSKFGVVL